MTEHIAEDDTYRLTFDKTFTADQIGVLEIQYTGILNDKMSGFYRSKYVVNGEERYMATTQFEAVDARRAFPCWDEPALKANFVVKLTVPSHLTALSNMPEQSIEWHGKTKTVTFDESRTMSTYLLAFVVGEFDVITSVSKGGVKFSVYTPLGKYSQGVFGLDVGIRVLDYFSEYFDIPYILPKMDMIAIPDFAAGAMENWGLVTYRETALLCDESSTIQAKKRVAYVIAHELAHQWFGNLVTMEWWKELWLNEGFATYIGVQATDFCFPDWDMWTGFVTDYLNHAFKLDSLESSHPIEVEIYRSSQIDEIFDAISYSKGASVIRMLASVLGDGFRKGLQIYLKRFSFKNAVTTDLWDALEEASGQPVRSMMTNWTQCVGYPVVTVEKVGDNKLRLTQKRFLAQTSNPTPGQDNVVWHIKAVLLKKSKTGQPETTVIDFNSKSLEVDFDWSNTEWLKLNSGQTGVYRVKYVGDAVSYVTQGMSSLRAEDRLGVVSDAFALSKSGSVGLDACFKIVSSLRDSEEDYTVWLDILDNLGDVNIIWEGKPNFEKLKAYRLQLLTPIVTKLGYAPVSGESPLRKLLRPLVLSSIGASGHEETIKQAQSRIDKLLAGEAVPLEERGWALSVVMRNSATAEIWDKVAQLFETADRPEERINYLRALGLTRDSALNAKALEYGLSGKVRSQDVFILFDATASTASGRVLTWEFIQARWKDIFDRFNGGQFLLRRFVTTVNSFSDLTRANEITAFFKTNHVDGMERTVSQTTERISILHNWVQREQGFFAQFQ